jgi:hypothetical protein
MMNLKQVLSYFTLAAIGLAAASSLLALVSAPAYAQQAAVAIDNDDPRSAMRFWKMQLL